MLEEQDLIKRIRDWYPVIDEVAVEPKWIKPSKLERAASNISPAAIDDDAPISRINSQCSSPKAIG